MNTAGIRAVYENWSAATDLFKALGNADSDMPAYPKA